MDPAKARAALQLIEYISDRLTQTRLLFASDAEHKKTFHGEAAQAVRDWRRSSVCMFPGCDQRTITASHTLQRAGPISPLLEDDHVLTPRSYKGRLSMVKIGGAEASTFPGYCAGHESAFSSFERARRIRSETDLALQVFRSLCREIRRKEFDLARLETRVADLHARLSRDVEHEARRLGVEFSTFTYQGMNLNLAEDYIEEAAGTLAELQALHAAHYPAVEQSGPTALEGTAFEIELPFPVALSGMTDLHLPDRTVMCLLGVIPQDTGTLIFMVGPPGSQDRINGHLEHKTARLPLIDMIERWMIRGTDHWFIKPSVWRAIPAARQRALLAEMQKTSHGIGTPLTLSIFDDMRREAAAVAFGRPPGQASSPPAPSSSSTTAAPNSAWRPRWRTVSMSAACGRR